MTELSRSCGVPTLSRGSETAAYGSSAEREEDGHGGRHVCVVEVRTHVLGFALSRCIPPPEELEPYNPTAASASDSSANWSMRMIIPSRSV